jgi:hypothetical protein
MDPVTIAFGLAQYAPSIIKWLSGSEKAEEAAQKVIDVARVVTGKQDASEAVVAIQADPAVLMQFRQAMAGIEADMDRAYLADRQNARGRDVAFVQAGRWNIRADLLALLSVTGLIVCVWFVARDSSLPERAVNAIMFVAGTLAACVRDVFAFEFGSSRGSRDKDALIADKGKA